MLETTLGIIFIVVGISCLLVLRFEPTYIADRSKRYIQPKRKGVKK